MTGTTARLERPEVIFFDLGDTLIRPEPSWTDIYHQACRDWGLDIDRETLHAALLEGAKSPFWDDVGQFEATREASFARIREYDEGVMASAGFPDLPEAFFRQVAVTFAARSAWHIFPDVIPALDVIEAAGIRMAVISNWMWEATELVHELELARHFEVLIISAQVGYQKPNEGIFRAALERTGVSPERAVHVGDSYRADVVGARAAGITPVLIARGHATAVTAGQSREVTDVAVIEDLYGLLDLLGLERPRDVEQRDAGAATAAS